MQSTKAKISRLRYFGHTTLKPFRLSGDNLNCSEYLTKDVHESSSWITDNLDLCKETPLTLFETRALPYLVTSEMWWMGAEECSQSFNFFCPG